MEEQTLELAIPWLLPGIEAQADECPERLAENLSRRRGIRRAHVEREKDPPDLCLHYDPEVLNGEGVRRLARRAGDGILARYHHHILPLEGLDCSDCALVVEHSLARIPGVLQAGVDFTNGTLRVEYDARDTSRRAILRRLRQLGYDVPASGWSRQLAANRELLASLLAGALLAAAWAAGAFFGLPVMLQSIIYLISILFGGFDVFRHSLSSLRHGHLDTHFLMVVAALGAIAIGGQAEAALLLFLFSLGHALEERTLERTRLAVKSLAGLSPRTALVRHETGERLLPVEALHLGDIVVVPSGARLPVDGVIVAGQSAIDQSPLTGESIPVDCGPGQAVFAGSLNGAGVLEVRATRLARDSSLARVMKLVEEAQDQQAPLQQVVERWMTWLVPAILALATGLTGLLLLSGVPFREALLRAMTVLVAASPCALVLASPSAVLAGVAQAARHGILVKGGAQLEALGRLNCLAFDKTGTLTQGALRVQQVTTNPGWDTVDLLAMAAALEGRSTHPIARAVVSAACQEGCIPLMAHDVRSEAGSGLAGRVGDQWVMVGSLAYLSSAGCATDYSVQDQADQLHQAGLSVVGVSVDGVLAGWIGLADSPRPEAARALQALRQMGIRRLVMLSGDALAPAAAIATDLGLSEARAQLSPADKLAAVHSLASEAAAQGGLAGMVGDGINDAPALAAAPVSIAVASYHRQGLASEAALETSGVVLMAPDLLRLPYAIRLGRFANRIIYQNLALSLCVMLLLAGLAIAGRAEIGPAVAVHEGSTLLVAVNALRLLRFSPE